MKALTGSAREALERHFEEARPRLAAAGADPDEVIDDLRRRVEEELAGRAPESVDAAEVLAMLERFGPIAAPHVVHAPPPPPYRGPKATHAPFWTGCFWVFAVALPLITIGVELWTHMSAEDYIDPLPTLVHVLVCLLVPVGQVYAIRAFRRGGPVSWKVLLAGGAVAGVSLFYTLLYLPLVPIGVAMTVILIGFLPLTPVLSLASSLVLASRLRRRAENPVPSFLAGLAAGFLFLVALDLPKMVTRVAASRVASGNPADREGALRLLRALGSRETLLRMCYVRSMGTDGVAVLVTDRVDTAQAREIYFRVTGHPFNSVPPPPMREGLADRMDAFDFEQGGTQVGEMRKGLSLSSSSLDGSVDAGAAVGYLEWTLVFANDAEQPAEARTQLALPPGAVVTRVTLWIDGEEREAAFAGRAQTRAAYEAVVRQRRDPVLVTTAGRDRILVQCFPVPAKGTMKTRIGFTVPLELASAEKARLALPQIAERNFRFREGLRHAAWIEGTGALSGGDAAVETRPDGSFAWRAEWAAGVGDRPSSVAVARPAAAPSSWAVDALDEKAPAIVRQTIETRTRAARPIVLVVDASIGLATQARGIASALRRAPAGAVAAVFVAADDLRRFDDPAGRAGSWTDQLERVDFVGGQDNVPALEAAWDLAAKKGGLIVWVHGPQPVLLSATEGLRQRWTRRPDGPELLALPVATGPNRVLESLDGADVSSVVVREGSVEEDLARLLAERSQERPVLTAVRDRQVGTQPATTPGKTSDHLVRLWARDEVLRLLPSPEGKLDDAIEVAGRYRLVTPVSGAVVLETTQQYAQAGLTPGQPGQVPTIPEPETWALIAIALATVAYAARRRTKVAWTRAA